MDFWFDDNVDAVNAACAKVEARAPKRQREEEAVEQTRPSPPKPPKRARAASSSAGQRPAPCAGAASRAASAKSGDSGHGATSGLELLSGGAAGADAAWVAAATAVGHRVLIVSFEGHSRVGATHSTVIQKTSQRALRNLMPRLEVARRRLGRKTGARVRAVGRLGYRDKLLLRNAALAVGASHMFAVGKKQRGASGVGVAGGTGWSCQLFADHAVAKLRRGSRGGKPKALNLFFFDQGTRKWQRCVAVPAAWPGGSPQFAWRDAGEDRPTLPQCGRVALVGTRYLSADGRAAIRALFPGSTAPPSQGAGCCSSGGAGRGAGAGAGGV